MEYYIVNTENRQVVAGPFKDRRECDLRHYAICANGIPNLENGMPDRPRVAVVCEDALVPNDHGNHFRFEVKKAEAPAVEKDKSK